jgi:hypothetical protein
MKKEDEIVCLVCVGTQGMAADFHCYCAVHTAHLPRGQSWLSHVLAV